MDLTTWPKVHALNPSKVIWCPPWGSSKTLSYLHILYDPYMMWWFIIEMGGEDSPSLLTSISLMLPW